MPALSGGAMRGGTCLRRPKGPVPIHGEVKQWLRLGEGSPVQGATREENVPVAHF